MIGAGLGTVGLAQTAAAWEDTDPTEIRDVRKSDEVQAILDELDYNGSIAANAVEKRVDSDLPAEEDVAITTYRAELDAGTLYYVALETPIAIFNFDRDGAELSKRARQRIDERFHGLPTDSNVSIHARDGTVSVRRTATEAERERVLSKISSDEHDNAVVVAESGLDGFVVNLVYADDGEVESVGVYTAVPETDVALETEALDEEIDLTVEFVETTTLEDEILPQMNGCGGICLDCAESIIFEILGRCRWCTSVCYVGMTPQGAVGCIGCVLLFCSSLLTTTNCALCADCID
ncbi:hypothetical protein [Natrarchaeobaculum aegyptiacum]|uniref:Uncharacterized protein n=1 Tax=Natrarchaeobaculum aegyptiacum TaxID=745377 RepID=A0A2Z2HW09_9EURY|nr:hypothetical protein [Natrarchaeobaculum aegyptiacum]ARS90385.1 hypothetical protein B1756_12045 [Natrarchaeobaculum aegyptiacum]